MVLAFDTYYFDNKAKTVCLVFSNWADKEPAQIYSEILENISEYVPGEFYKRELPCIMSLYAQITEPVDCIVVDGFVYLDDEQKPGLGARLYEALEEKIPVIGVAKTNFATIEKNKSLLLRGQSEKPLYITAIGMELQDAVECIREMEGAYRMPTLLKQLDTLTKA